MNRPTCADCGKWLKKECHNQDCRSGRAGPPKKKICNRCGVKQVHSVFGACLECMRAEREEWCHPDGAANIVTGTPADILDALWAIKDELFRLRCAIVDKKDGVNKR